MGFIGDIIGGAGQGKAQQAAIEQERYSTDQATHLLSEANTATQNDPYLISAENGGTAANTAQANLLGVGGDPAAQKQAFNNYLNSTGYQFQLKSGQDAIGSSMAAKGLLNSGATAKALTKYGNDLGASSFGNYFSQLGTVSAAGANSAQTKANSRLGVASQGANITAQSGANQANYDWKGITGQYNAYGNAASSVGSSLMGAI